MDLKTHHYRWRGNQDNWRRRSTCSLRAGKLDWKQLPHARGRFGFPFLLQPPSQFLTASVALPCRMIGQK